MGLANEPGKYSTANCMLVEYKFTMDELTDPSLVPEDLHGEDIVAIGIVTTRRSWSASRAHMALRF